MHRSIRRFGKLVAASLPPSEIHSSLLKASSLDPDALIRMLERASTVSSPNHELLAALAHRFKSSTDQYYPPQIMNVLQQFSQIGYSSSLLFEAFTSRMDDVLASPSPSRITCTSEMFARLNLPLLHPSVWDVLRAKTIESLPQMSAGLLVLVDSLSHYDCADDELIVGLFTQAEVAFQRDEMTPETFSRCLERFSRMKSPSTFPHLAHIINDCTAYFKSKKLTASAKLDLWVAACRLNSSAKESLEISFLESLEGSSNLSEVHSRKFGQSSNLKLRIVDSAAALGVQSDELSKIAFDQISKGEKDSLRSLLAAAKLVKPNESSDIYQRLRDQVDKIETSNLSDVSSKKLLVFLRAARLLNAEESVAEKITQNIFPRKFSLKEQRHFWNVQPVDVECKVQPLLPLLPESLLNAEHDVQPIGPFSVIGNKLWMPSWKLLTPNTQKETAEVRLIRNAFEIRGKTVDILPLLK